MSWLSSSRGKAVLASVLASVLFVAALVFWTRPVDSDPPSAAVTSGVALPPGARSTDALGSLSTSSSPTPSGSNGSGPLVSGQNLVPNLPGSTDANVDNLPVHRVDITVTSDQPMLVVGYKVAYGDPPSKNFFKVRSPVKVSTVGRGYGQVAVVGAQSGPYSTKLTCSIAIDGKVRTTKTLTKAFNVAVCTA